MWGELWFPFLGAVGAFIVESYITYIKTELRAEKGSRLRGTGIRYKTKVTFGIFTGFVLAYVLQPSDVTQAFAIGVGWEVILSSIIKDTNIVSVTDKRVLRTLNKKDLPKPDSTLKDAEKMIQKLGSLERIPIVDDKGRLMGIMTDGMIKRAIEEVGEDSTKKIKEFMIGATDVAKVDKHDSIAKAIKTAEQQSPDKKIESITVIDKEGLVKGLLSLNQLKMMDRSLFSK